MKPTTTQLLLAVVHSDETVSPEHAARIQQVVENGGVILLPVDGPLLTLAAAARDLGYCRPWLYDLLKREARWDAKDKTFQTVPAPGGGFRLRKCDVDAFKRRSVEFQPRRREGRLLPKTEISNVARN